MSTEQTTAEPATSLYRLIRIQEQGKLYEEEIANLPATIELAKKELESQQEEVEFYGITDQRMENVGILKDIVSILEFKRQGKNHKTT